MKAENDGGDDGYVKEEWDRWDSVGTAKRGQKSVMYTTPNTILFGLMQDSVVDEKYHRGEGWTKHVLDTCSPCSPSLQSSDQGVVLVIMTWAKTQHHRPSKI